MNIYLKRGAKCLKVGNVKIIGIFSSYKLLEINGLYNKMLDNVAGILL